MDIWCRRMQTLPLSRSQTRLVCKFVSLTTGALPVPLWFSVSYAYCIWNRQAISVVRAHTVCAVIQTFAHISHVFTVAPVDFQVSTTMDQRYTCVQSCGATWGKAGPFNRHQKSCKYWLAHEDNMRTRRAKAAAAPPLKKRKKVRSTWPFFLVTLT
jgi:hypothetical protein